MIGGAFILFFFIFVIPEKQIKAEMPGEKDYHLHDSFKSFQDQYSRNNHFIDSTNAALNREYNYVKPV